MRLTASTAKTMIEAAYPAPPAWQATQAEQAAWERAPAAESKPFRIQVAREGVRATWPIWVLIVACLAGVATAREWGPVLEGWWPR